jgi:hypothetical protein
VKQKFRYWAVFLIVIILGSSLVGAAEDYQISPEGASPDKSYQALNPYYFVHYFYLYIIESYRLSSRFDTNARLDMISKTFYSLSSARPTKVTIRDYDGADLMLTFTLFNDGFMHVLNLRSNYLLLEQRFLKEQEDYKKALVSFDITARKMVPERCKFSAEKEAKLKDNLNNLADLYIFDDIAENDKLIEDNLQQYIKATVKPMEQLGGTLTLIQYYTSIKDFANAKAALGKASQIMRDLLSDPKELQQAKAFYTFIEEEYQVTMKLANGK